MNRQLNITIVGAGFAGLASAVLLARQGHTVTVFEQFASPQAVGAGVLIQPTGLAAMKTLGVLDEVLQKGSKIESLYGVTPKGRPVIDIQYKDWRTDSFGLGLHRGVLFQSLWAAAAAAGVRIQTGAPITDLASLRRDDLRIIADGSHSALRAQTGLPFKQSMYPWGAVWAVLPDPQHSYGTTLWQWYRQANQMLGIMPTGQTPNDPTPVVSLFWSMHQDRYPAFLAAGIDAWKAQVLALNPACEALLSSIQSIDQLTWARYYDVVMPRYHSAETVVIGDAAHAMSPQLGQGTNLALMDAVALGQCVAQANDVAQALNNYTFARKQHLEYYSQVSRLLTPVFQSDLSVLPWLRDALMARSLRWPIAGKINLETLVGVRTGWLGGRIAEAPKNC
jgi:2-polyprenyl-6-methoxyphenol hydroxylase-like FAD-dependent oxidoreductase